MKTLDHHKPGVVNKTRSNIFGWRGQFTPAFVVGRTAIYSIT